MNKANYTVVDETPGRIILKDVGPWSEHPTITNAAETVVADLAAAGRLNGRRLLYFDSEGELGELVYHEDKFSAFAYFDRRML
jgi:hypothetical protein